MDPVHPILPAAPRPYIEPTDRIPRAEREEHRRRRRERRSAGPPAGGAQHGAGDRDGPRVDGEGRPHIDVDA